MNLWVDKAIKDPWIQQKPMFKQQDPMAMSLFLKNSWIEEANIGLISCQRNKPVFLGSCWLHPLLFAIINHY